MRGEVTKISDFLEEKIKLRFFSRKKTNSVKVFVYYIICSFN